MSVRLISRDGIFHAKLVYWLALSVMIRRHCCRKTGLVKQELIEWIAANPFYTKQFGDFVGRKCRSMKIKDVAKELHLDWHIVKELKKEYMRKLEYARVTGRKRKFIKGQKYVLLSNRENLSSDGKKSLRLLLAANHRLNAAYVSKESFSQLWDYESEAWARKFKARTIVNTWLVGNGDSCEHLDAAIQFILLTLRQTRSWWLAHFQKFLRHPILANREAKISPSVIARHKTALYRFS
jgi:hypothetical protein